MTGSDRKPRAKTTGKMSGEVRVTLPRGSPRDGDDAPLRALLAATRDVALLVDERDVVRLASDAITPLLGHRAVDLCGGSISDVILGAEASASAADEHARREGVAIARHADGSTLACEYVERDVGDGTRVVLLSPHEVDFDTESDSEIRRRIAFDLHDAVGPPVVGAYLLAKSLAQEIPGELGRRAERLAKMTQLASRRLRAVSEGLLIVEHSGTLAEMLLEIAACTSDVYGLGCRVDVRTPTPAFSSLQREQCMLLVQEAVHNAARHGSPTEIVVEAREHDGEFVVRVRDDGQGWTGAPSQGFGARSMRHRAARLGGVVTFESAETGVTVTLRFPVLTSGRNRPAAG